MSAKPANLVSSLVNAADQQATSPRLAKDASRTADLAQATVNGRSGEPASADDKPQKFELALSNAQAAQQPEAKAPASKAKADAVDAKDSAQAEAVASPDIALLMSLLPALPAGDAAPAASAAATSPPSPDDAMTVAAVSSDAAGRAAPTPNTPATALTPVLPQASAGDATKFADATVVAAGVAGSSNGAVPGGEVRLADKPDLFASVLANLETPAPASVPMMAAPTHQATTLTAVALALPVTAPGSLDELPISHNEWPAALGHRLLWAVGEGMQKAVISVSPQDMGPINVHIRVENDKADIRFTAAHAQTREMLESSMPRLRDMFSQQGLNLSQAQVFSQNSHDTHGRQPDTNTATPSASNANADEAQDVEPPRPMQWRRGLVDEYA